MRILVIGAGGFIGGRVISVLLARGHSIVCAGRTPKLLRQRFRDCEAVPVNFDSDDANAWLRRLSGVDAVINAAGALRGELEIVHRRGPIALFDACARACIPRLIQISALGAGQQNNSRFLATKNAADEHLIRLAREGKRSGWCVVRPSLVVGRGGGSTELFSALAGAPWPIRLGDGTWRIQPVHVSDLACILASLIEQSAVPPVLEVVGPEPMTTDELTTMLRAWLGLPARPFLSLPAWFITTAARIGDFLPASPLSTETVTMLSRGSTAEKSALQAALGRTPRRVSDALRAEPAVRADRWLARMLPARVVLRAALIAVWVGSGVASFALPPKRAVLLLTPVALGGSAVAITWSGAALDIVLGLALLVRSFRRRALQSQFVVMAAYTVLAAIIVPELWGDPFGSLLKNVAVFAATWVLLAIED